MEELIEVCLNEKPADLLLHGELFNVYTGDITESYVAVKGGRIAYIGQNPVSSIKKIDLHSNYILPAFIDGHIHIESSMLTPSQFAVSVIPRGTCCVVTDPHEIANVMGVDGVRYMIEDSSRTPLKVYVTIPSCVPSTELETSGAFLGIQEIEEMKEFDCVIGLGEVMNYPGVISRDPDVIKKIKTCSNLLIEGHAPGLTGEKLSAYISAGIYSEHEATSREEALEKIALGIRVMIREGTASKDLSELVNVVNHINARRFILVTDDLSAEDILSKGHIDYLLKRAVEEGVDPVEAIRMATLNSAEYFGLKHLGGLAPGMFADISVVDSLKDFNVTHVFLNGELVAKSGAFKGVVKGFPSSYAKRRTTNFRQIHPEDLAIKYLDGEEAKVRVIGVIEGQIKTEALIEKLAVSRGIVEPDLERDILKVCVVERHKGTGRIGRGFVKGLGLMKGAIASTVAHDSHNVVSVGTEDEEMCGAINRIRELGGGLVVYSAKTVAELPLPVAGLMTPKGVAEVTERVKEIGKALTSLGCSMSSPFSTISFLTLPVIPALKITDRGIIDVDNFKIVDLFIDGEGKSG